MPDVPTDPRYSKDHRGARFDAGTSVVRVGVTDFAQEPLGDVVDVTLRGRGETIRAGVACGVSSRSNASAK
jgi:glycine cleavage system H protein